MRTAVSEMELARSWGLSTARLRKLSPEIRKAMRVVLDIPKRNTLGLLMEQLQRTGTI